MKLFVVAALLSTIFKPILAMAEIEKISAIGEKGIKFFWWPKMQVPTGWKHDRDSSLDLRANVLEPKGSDFKGARTVIYSRAFYEADQKKRQSLKQFIEEDIADMKGHASGFQVKELANFKTKGTSLKAYSFKRSGKASEIVCYGQEGEFKIMFVMSSKSETYLKRDLPIFRKILATYN